MLELAKPPKLHKPELCVLPLKNTRWEEFVVKYNECGNATEAARAVGVNDKYATQEAQRFLSMPEIKARIAYLESEQLKKALVTEGTITEELAIIAYSSTLDYIVGELVTDPIIRVKPGVNEKQLRAISEIEVTDTVAGTRKVKFKLHSKTAAIGMAMQLKGYGAGNKASAANGASNGSNGAGNENSNGNSKNEKESPEEILKGLGLKIA